MSNYGHDSDNTRFCGMVVITNRTSSAILYSLSRELTKAFMAGGSSGGPWIQNFGVPADGQTGGMNAAMNRIIGITPYGYNTLDKKSQSSSIPDSRFSDMFNAICAHKTGNCT